MEPAVQEIITALAVRPQHLASWPPTQHTDTTAPRNVVLVGETRTHAREEAAISMMTAENVQMVHVLFEAQEGTKSTCGVGTSPMDPRGIPTSMRRRSPACSTLRRHSSA